MKAHVLQHVPFEDVGSIAEWLAMRRATVTYTRFYESSALPRLADVDLLIVMGGPMSVNDTQTFPWLQAEAASPDGSAAHTVDSVERFSNPVVASRWE